MESTCSVLKATIKAEFANIDAQSRKNATAKTPTTDVPGHMIVGVLRSIIFFDALPNVSKSKPTNHISLNERRLKCKTKA